MDDGPASLGERDLAQLRQGVPSIRAVRRRLRMTQEEFAAAFGFSLSSVRDWEQARHAPDRNTIPYLRLIASDPVHIAELVAKLETTGGQ